MTELEHVKSERDYLKARLQESEELRAHAMEVMKSAITHMKLLETQRQELLKVLQPVTGKR